MQMLKGYQYKMLLNIYIIERNNKIYAVTTNKIYDYIEEETELIKKAATQLNEYFQGKRTVFDLPLDYEGTPFQIKVWQELQKIPYGQTRSYKEIAKAINNPKAYRAVGNANNHNRIMIIIPCHRVIGSNNKLVGYAGGLKMKEMLLSLERNNDSTSFRKN